jgi:hypothetical protein
MSQRKEGIKDFVYAKSEGKSERGIQDERNWARFGFKGTG